MLFDSEVNDLKLYTVDSILNDLSGLVDLLEIVVIRVILVCVIIVHDSHRGFLLLLLLVHKRETRNTLRLMIRVQHGLKSTQAIRMIDRLGLCLMLIFMSATCRVGLQECRHV